MGSILRSFYASHTDMQIVIYEKSDRSISIDLSNDDDWITLNLSLENLKRLSETLNFHLVNIGAK